MTRSGTSHSGIRVSKSVKKYAGRYVALEGLDGAGTSTQLASLAAELRRRGRKVVATAEPSPGPVGVLIRQALAGRTRLPSGEALDERTMALLFAADRADHDAAVVTPGLAAGAIVLSDRSLMSSLAYQAPTFGLPWVAALNRFARLPDLILFLRVTPTLGAKRLAVRGANKDRYEALATQRKVARAYEKALAYLRTRGTRIAVLDGAASAAEVTKAALAVLEKDGA